MVILIIAVIISSMLYSSYKEKQQEEARKEALIAMEQQLCDSYINYMNNGAALMYTDAADAEEICNLISEVWYNSIYHKSDKKTNKYTAGTNDFNDAISNVYADKDILDKIQDMFETEGKIESFIKEHTDIPDDIKETYDLFLDLYVTYQAIVKVIESPSGNYESYNDNCSEKFDQFITAYQKLNARLPKIDDDSE